jgi:hypothetical protein
MHGDAKENIDDFFFIQRIYIILQIGQSRWHYKMQLDLLNSLDGCGSHVSLKSMKISIGIWIGHYYITISHFSCI